MRIAALDIGGTHARMAVAEIGSGERVRLGSILTLKTRDYPGIEAAWRAFADLSEERLPEDAAIAIAAPVWGNPVRMTNADWSIDMSGLAERMGLKGALLLNDFAAVAHAVADAAPEDFSSITGPEMDLPQMGTISVIGPGTGLGVAHFHRTQDGYNVQATEGAHMGFSPRDALEDALLTRLRARYGRVSVERVVSGPGLAEIHAALGVAGLRDDATIWQLGLAGEDPLCRAAIERFCDLLGSVAGDYALAHGATGVVLSGSLANRMRALLTGPGFAANFTAKGRYEQMMSAIPVKLITLPEPGLIGVAIAFAKERGT